jgi:ADP-ribosylarginine hydrolase
MEKKEYEIKEKTVKSDVTIKLKATLEERIKACMVLHAVGDTIGFKNGDWEFNYGKKIQDANFSNELLYEFIYLGGINNIDLKNWIVSDDTVMHIATTKALLEDFKNMDDLGDILAQKYVDSFKDMKNGKRYPGEWTQKSVNMLIEGKKWNEIPFSPIGYGDGSGASMRTAVIGLAFPNEENREKLIITALEASRITHNSPTGYLGGITTALFTAFALERKPINTWAHELMGVLESGIIEEYLKRTRGLKQYLQGKDFFIANWRRYIDDKFTKKRIIQKNLRNPAYRSNYYHTNFSFPNTTNYFPGSGGHDSVIIAYDALIDCIVPVPSWEKLVIYSMLHVGDSDTTGSIAGAWYGAYFGFQDIPEGNLKYLEKKEELLTLSSQIYEKFKSNYKQRKEISLSRSKKKTKKLKDSDSDSD